MAIDAMVTAAVIGMAAVRTVAGSGIAAVEMGPYSVVTMTVHSCSGFKLKELLYYRPCWPYRDLSYPCNCCLLLVLFL